MGKRINDNIEITNLIFPSLEKKYGEKILGFIEIKASQIEEVIIYKGERNLFVKNIFIEGVIVSGTDYTKRTSEKNTIIERSKISDIKLVKTEKDLHNLIIEAVNSKPQSICNMIYNESNLEIVSFLLN